MPSARKSLIYDYFGAGDNDDRLQCNHCKSKISKKATNLEKHVRTVHPDVFAEYMKKKTEKQDNIKMGSTKVQLKMARKKPGPDSNKVDDHSKFHEVTLVDSTILSHTGKKTNCAGSAQNIMEKLCRLCARRCFPLTSVYSFSKDRLVLDMIMTTCPIKIDRNDGLPQNICEECLEVVVSAIELRETSVKSESLLKSEDINVMEDESKIEVKKEQPEMPDVQEFNDCKGYSSESSSAEVTTSSSKFHNNFVNHSIKSEFCERKKENFECDKCGRHFPYLQDLDKHLHQRHNIGEDNNEKIFTCHICGQVYTKSKLFRAHLKRHREENAFSCTLCPKRFSSKNGLNYHAVVHSKERPFVCETCGSSFKVKNMLKLHMHNIHSNADKTHACKFCDKKFFSSYKLAVHVRTHTGEKPFQCDFCDVAYAQKNDCLRHMGRVHVGDKLYKCTIDGCPEAFRLKADLTDHYQVHFKPA